MSGSGQKLKCERESPFPLRARSGLTRGKKSWLAATLAQAGALLISHIAPGSRTLAPSA
jgi:hypothetical protein